MKSFKTICLLILTLLFANIAFSQQSRSSWLKAQKEKKSNFKVSDTEASAFSIWKSRKGKSYQPKLEADTLNYPLAGTYAVYVYAGGYVSGNNDYNDKVKAEYFNPVQPVELSSVMIDFAVATSSQANIEIAVWDNSGAGGKPGNKLTNTQIVLDDILINILNDQSTLVTFDTPIFIATPFYIGAYLPTSAGDTLVVYSNTDGDTNPATAWEQWNDNDWYPMDDPNSWDRKIAHAIFPIVNYSNDLFPLFSAVPTQVLPGQSVQFSDESYGSPVSWSWTFEGGEPGMSNEQNPQVVYNQTGEFSVKLVISNGETQDSLTKNNYISVLNELPANIDTLLFPLPGSYVVYIITDNGGFVTGNNKFNDLAKANYFELPEQGQIIGVLYDFAWAVGGNPQIELKIWDNDGADKGSPGSVLASTARALDLIKTDIENSQLTYFPVTPPIQINHPFYAGFTLPTNTGDTLVAWSNTNGDTNPTIVWDLWDDNTWHTLTNTFELNIAMGVHPIVEYPTGIKILKSDIHKISALPNPTSGLARFEIPNNEKLLEIQVYDLHGQEIIQQKVTTGNLNIQIDLSCYPLGNYLVKLITDKQIYAVKIVRE